MICIPKTPSKSLPPALLKIKPGREQFEQFKTRLSGLVEQINGSPNESEEHHKNHISDFLKYAFKFPAYFINTNDRIDLVIHNGKSPTDTVGVIIEVKRPTNQAEMPSQDNINVKAMQELVLYYLRERITANNLAVKHLAVTNGYEWFIFDANVFEKAFAQNKALVKQFNEFDAGHLSGNTTDFFYKEIAKPVIDKIVDIEFTHFDLREKSSDKKLISLFKLLSPEHLLKLPFVNDSNSLNKDFYSELLYIIGLAETKEGSKKLIQRNKEGERNRGSLLENAITKLDAQDRLRHFEKLSLFGETKPEQLFNVGLTLLDAALDLDGQIIPGKSTLILTSSDATSLKYICAILNSKLILNYIKERYSSSSYNGGIVFTKEMINDIPLPADEIKKTKVVALVDQILALKKQNSSADTSALEKEIDQLVYALYGLTPEEIALVEGNDRNVV